MWTQAERRALRYIATGEYDKAISEYQKLLSEVGDDPDIYNAIGDLYIKKNEIEKAVEAYEKAIDLYKKDGLIENAIAVARKALRYDESNKYLYITLSELYSQIGRHDEALGYLSAFLDRGVEKEDVVRLHKAFKEIASSLSKDMERQKRFERLFTRFQQIVEEMGSMTLDEARAELERTGGKLFKLNLSESREKAGEEEGEKYETAKYEQPVEEPPSPLPETHPLELEEKELEKAASWPTKEFERKVWREEELPTKEGAPEPWEHAEELAGEQTEKQETERQLLPESLPPTGEIPQQAEIELPEPLEQPESPQQIEQPPLIEDVSAILDEIVGEENYPSVERKTMQPSEPETTEQLFEGYGVQKGVDKSVEEPSPYIEEKRTVRESPKMEEVSPVDLFLESTPEPGHEIPQGRKTPVSAPGIRDQLVEILKHLGSFLSSSANFYYPNLDPLEFGRILMNMKIYEEAFFQFQRYTRYHKPSDNPTAFFDAMKLGGMALFYAGKYRLAVKQFQKAIQMNSHDPELFYLVGLSYEKLGDYRKALDAYENAYLIDADFRDVAERIEALLKIERS